ncbi:MAG: hypothetical protein EOO45_24945 [Flavobacterium sp.]|nr:MAG: hypothetical protein EOO45_24945 [Flavobacterium sp.]
MDNDTNPLVKLINQGERYSSTGGDYFGFSTTKLLMHAFSMFEKIPYDRGEQFVIPEEYIEFLKILKNDMVAPLAGQDLLVYGIYEMVVRTFDYFDCEGGLGKKTAFWLAVGHRSDRGNFFLCCDTASERYGQVGEFYDSSPFNNENDFYGIGTSFPDFCRNVLNGEVIEAFHFKF